MAPWWHKVVTLLGSSYFVLALGVVFLVSELRFGRNDFDIFLAAGKDLLSQADIYTKTYFDGYHYYYSLFFAAIMAIASLVPVWIAKGLWMGLNMIMLFKVWKLILAYLPFSKPNERSVYFRRMLFGVILFLISIRFIRANLHFGQVTVLLLYLSLEGLSAIRRGKWWGGILLALGINIKWMPLVLLPYLLYRKEIRALTITTLAAVALWYLPLLWLDTGYFFQMTHSYWQLINPAQTKHLLDVEEGSFHGLTTWISTLFHKAAREHNALPWRRHLADLPVDVVVILVNAVRLLVVFLTLLFLRAKLFASVKQDSISFFEWSWLLATIPLIFPHQQHYAFLLMTPAVAYVLWTWMNTGMTRSNRIGFVVVVVLFNLSLLVGGGVALYNHYKIVTIGGLLLLCVLYRIKPKFETS